MAKDKLNKIEKKLEEKKTISRKGETRFYHFRQNNSGGYFDENNNVCINVFIEAHSDSEANLLADNFGIYFDGCEQGIDCSCCGDRWYPVDKSDGEKELVIFDNNSEKKVDIKKVFASMYSDKCIIHYLDGRKEIINFKTEDDCKKHIWKQQYTVGKKCIICGKWKKSRKARR